MLQSRKYKPQEQWKGSSKNRPSIGHPRQRECYRSALWKIQRVQRVKASASSAFAAEGPQPWAVPFEYQEGVTELVIVHVDQLIGRVWLHSYVHVFETMAAV